MKFILSYSFLSIVSAAVETNSTLLKIENPNINSQLLEPTANNIKKYSYYASAAICPEPILKEWGCNSCQKAEKGTELIAIMENNSYGTRGYIAINKVDREIIIAFRGTDNWRNKLTNLNVLLTPFKHAGEKAEVHGGFLGAIKSLEIKFLNHTSNILKDPRYSQYSLVLVGHSMGGSMASLATAIIQSELGLDWSRLSLYTYGQPRTGNPNFAQWYDSKPMTLARVVNSNDRVPHIISNFGGFYAHHQNEIWLKSNNYLHYCSNTVLEDPDCSNSIDTKGYSDDAHLFYFAIFGNAAC